MNHQAEIGIMGLGVMGRSLALNFAENGISVAGYNRHVPGVEEHIAKHFVEENPQQMNLQGFDNLKEFIDALAHPRKILIMIKAGDAVDMMLENMLPLLDEGDILMDGGNSLYKDTNRRNAALAAKSIHFLGIGISGGEEGARKGPSIMPGGSKNGYEAVKDILKKIAAKDSNKEPCCTYIGDGGAGHFVKMVHNGIEYAEMQLIAESYFLLKEFAGLEAPEIAAVFRDWNNGEAGSYLLEITIDILAKKEGDDLILDKILDAAEQKGTGWWTAAAAMEMGKPFSIISEAVMARNLSAQKKKRVKMADIYDLQNTNAKPSNDFKKKLHEAYQIARIINHAVGFDFIYGANELFNSKFNLREISRIWTNGCIIRSKLMERMVDYFSSTNSLLEHPEVISHIKKGHKNLAEVVAGGILNNIPLPVFAAAQNYFTGITTANSSANMIQAQRDYFGAHTYRRIDKTNDEYFHTEW